MKYAGKINFSLLVFYLISVSLFSQNPDSLKLLLKTANNDIVRIKLLNELAETAPENEWPAFNEQMRELAEQKLKTEIVGKPLHNFYLKYLAGSFNNKGLFNQTRGNISKALVFHTKSLEIYREIKDKAGEAFSLNNIGYMYYNQGDIKKALEYQHGSLKMQEEIGDKFGIASALNFIAAIYENQNETAKALECYEKSLKIYREINYTQGVALTFNNLGFIYQKKGNYIKAIECYEKSSKLFEKINYKEGFATSLLNIGNTYQLQGNSKKAFEYLNRALKIQQEIGDKKGMTMSLHNIGTIYQRQKNLNKALVCGLQSLTIARELTFPKQISDAAFLLKNIYQSQNKTADALKMFELYITMRDSVINQENRKATIQKQLQYIFDKKAVADSIKTAAEQKVKDAQLLAGKAQLKQEKTTRYVLFGGLALVIIFSIFIYHRFTITRKQKNIIEIQKTEVEKQKEIVEEQKLLVEVHQKEIIDSITYAKRLQEAILPPQEYINEYFPDNFVLYKPKDIVAGDFYWMEHIDNITFFAAADSTGHGVPGAMVSVVCSNALNRSVKEFGLRKTGEILDKTRELVLETFAKSSRDVKDGMDISLLSINSIDKKVNWSGANNPLWYISKPEAGGSQSEAVEDILYEIKANKQPIGKTENPSPFITQEISYSSNSIFYLFTDGYPDQFGGPKGKKFKYKQLKEILAANAKTNLKQQQEILDAKFEEWAGNLEQVDDVTVIGIRI